MKAASGKPDTALTAEEAATLRALVAPGGYRDLAKQAGVHHESLLAAACGCSCRRGTVALIRQTLAEKAPG